MESVILSGANRITLAAALRGTAAMAIPFALFRLLGHPVEAIFSAVAGLNVSIADTGGPYRTRLAAMGMTTLMMPVVVFGGTQVQGILWLDALLMFMVAFLGGLARTFGPVGTAVGLISSLIFLIGMHIPGTVLQSLARAGAYFVGGAWTLLLTLFLWRLLPYKRVELETASCLSETAGLISAARGVCSAENAGRAQCEQDLTRKHRKVRDTIEQARAALGQALSDENADATVAQLIVLLSAAAEISGAMLHLGEILSRGLLQKADLRLRSAVDAVLEEFERDCRSLSAALATRKGEISLNAAREKLGSAREALKRTAAGGKETAPPHVEGILTALNRSLLHLENAQDALNRLLGQSRRVQGVLPPLAPGASGGGRLQKLSADLTFDSLLFRHAFRVALATSAGVVLYMILDLPNGIWIPLSTLVVLQPNFGATFQRTLSRTGGTMLGAGLAALAVFSLQGTPGMYAAIVASMFATLLFFRRRYGIAVVFLTPYIILLLDLVLHRPWVEVIDRIRDTAAGAAIALASGYLLWPLWEKKRLPAQLADALGANRDYLKAVLQALQAGRPRDRTVAELRRKAEIESGNAEAAFERMQAEPKRNRLSPDRSFTLVTFIRRLNRHTTELALHLEEFGNGLPGESDLGGALTGDLEEIAQAVAQARPPAPLSGVAENYAPFRASLYDRRDSRDEKAADPHRPRPGSVRTTIGFVLDRIVDDIADLHAAAGELNRRADGGE